MFYLTVFVMAVMFAVGYALGCKSGYDKCERDAIKHGAAEYYLDENHNRQFRWLDETKK